MATAYVVLGATTPAATTLTTLVTGSTNGSIVASITACNKGGSNDSIRVAVTKSGGSTYYQYYNFTLGSGATLERQPGMSLASGDTISVYSTTGNTDFIATGVTQ
jgi:glucose-6-phosphate dehydrogenase assembly protein OpcA